MSIAATAAWSLIYWTDSIYGAQLGLVFYGFSQNYEVVYFAYIYATVSKDHFSTVSSFTHAALLAGRFVNILFTIYLLPYISWTFKCLHYVTIAVQAIATSFVLKLPTVKNHTSSSPQMNARNHIAPSINNGQRMLKQLKCTYTNDQVLLWSIWYVCGTAVFNQMTIILTSLSKLLPENDNFVSQTISSSNTVIFNFFYIRRQMIPLEYLHCYWAL